jgi:hypothetical protein
MAKLQLTGFATIAKSKELPQEVKDQILEAGEGKKKAVRAKLVDGEGNETVLSGPLGESSKGSLTARFAMKVESFEIIEVDDPDLEEDKKPSKEEKAKASAEALAAELLG